MLDSLKSGANLFNPFWQQLPAKIFIFLRDPGVYSLAPNRYFFYVTGSFWQLHDICHHFKETYWRNSFFFFLFVGSILWVFLILRIILGSDHHIIGNYLSLHPQLWFQLQLNFVWCPLLPPAGAVNIFFFLKSYWTENYLM